MRLKQCLAISFFSFIFLFMENNALAAKIYPPRIPFSLSITADDKLVVNYNFAEKNGIRCTADKGKVLAKFTYKGEQKQTSLPVILESSHVPDRSSNKKHEEFADVAGQFTLVIDKTQATAEAYQVRCSYIEE